MRLGSHSGGEGCTYCSENRDVCLVLKGSQEETDSTPSVGGIISVINHLYFKSAFLRSNLIPSCFKRKPIIILHGNKTGDVQTWKWGAIKLSPPVPIPAFCPFSPPNAQYF